MPMTAEQFVHQLEEQVPEARPVLAEHLEDQEGELLLHLLLADLLRLAVQRFHSDERDVADRCLLLVDRALREGDEYVQNAVAVSFVENVGVFPGETDDFIASWPQGLLNEKASQDRT
jgi:hypothetical protein